MQRVLGQHWVLFLHGLAQDVASRLETPEPLVLVFKGNLLMTLLEELGIIDFRCNAFASSITPSHGLICIGEDLIEKGLTIKELEGVIAHETSHVKKNHVMKSVGMFILIRLFCKLLIHLMDGEPKLTTITILHNNNATYKYGSIGITKGLISTLLAGILLLVYTRMNEKEADLTAVTVLDDPMALANALDKLSSIYDEKARLIDWIKTLKSTHPLMKDRKKYLEEYKDANAVNTTLGLRA